MDSKIDNMFTNRKIAIMPLDLIVSNKYSSNDRIKNIIGDSLKLTFLHMGFEVIDYKTFEKDVDSIKSSFGGFFDIKTGLIDTMKVSEFKSVIMRHVFIEYGVNTILFPSIRIATAYIQNGGYCWDGRYYHSFAIGNVFGRTSALSLYVQIFDTNENMIFDNAGGIQPLYKVRTINFAETKDEEILRKSKDLSKALQIVFDPINEKINAL